MNFGLQASPLKTSIMSLASSIAATAKEVNAEKETQRTEERAGKPARGEARVAEHRRDGAREAAGRMQRHDVARFAERLAGAERRRSEGKSEHTKESRAPTDNAAANHGAPVRASAAPHIWETPSSVKAESAKTQSVTEASFETQRIENDLARIIARAEAVRKEVLTQSLIEGVNEFSSNLAESEAEAEQPSANFVASAYRTTERQAAELLAHA